MVYAHLCWPGCAWSMSMCGVCTLVMAWLCMVYESAAEPHYHMRDYQPGNKPCSAHCVLGMEMGVA